MIFRILGPFGLGILFILTSTDLRRDVMDGIAAAVVYLEKYSPYSYVALALITLVVFLFSLKSKNYESSIS